MKKHLYVDFHIVQTVPPSCVNRDDTGSPKTAVYGGTTRARVSSQAWKRAVRQQFLDELAEENVGIRTRYVCDQLAKHIRKLDESVDAEMLAKIVLNALKVDNSDKDSVLFFTSGAQLEALAKETLKVKDTILQIIKEEAEAKEKKQKKKKKDMPSLPEEELKEALNSKPAYDIALFGRMAAGNPALNVDAACQVAHSISTHTVHNEFDYFTAMDDCAAEDTTGAAHLGITEFHSATLYRYATICVPALRDSLGGDADTLSCIGSFADAFIRSMPTGHQNSFANRTAPDFAYVTIRTDQPVNLVGAFESPVKTSTGGYSQPSIDVLKSYAGRVYESFADAPVCAFCCSTSGEVDEEFATMLPIRELPKRLEAELGKYMDGEE